MLYSLEFITIISIICYTLLYPIMQSDKVMNISLTPELEKFVQDKVVSGMYTSASEVIRESLRLLHTYEDMQAHRFNQLNQEIDIGMQQLKSGKKILAKDSYNRLKNKINKTVKESE